MKTTTITLFLTVSLALSALAETFVVDNIFDPGSGVCDADGCTLREAIDAANANPGADIITFNIFGAGVHTITPSSELPEIIETVTIDGYTQPGASANTLAVGHNASLLIELDGSLVGSSGLTLAAAGCVIRGVVINRFTAVGISIKSTSNVIEGNFIGTDAAGAVGLGNFQGISVFPGTGNLIGGILPAARNLISGNSGAGIDIFSSSSNTVQGNYIGTDRSGTKIVPNEHGISVVGSFLNLLGGADPGAGNLISGNDSYEIAIGGGGSGERVLGNLIGTDATGTVALSSSNGGLFITDGAHDNTIGDSSPSGRNIISGHTIAILIELGSANSVQGNYIGTDVSGSIALGNGDGILINLASDNLIGGAYSGAGNLISANAIGISVRGLDATGNMIQGNFVGTNAGGLENLGNVSSGILLTETSSGTTIGGLGAAGNIIAFTQEGSAVAVNNSSGNTISGNSIFGSGSLGINLSGGSEDSYFVTANDVGDADAGSNNLQNYPVINEITVSGASRTAAGQLNSAANTDYTLDFYSNTEVDPSGFGEGETYLGSLAVQTKSLGEVFFSFPLAAGAAGKFITATATDPDGNTSEFSKASAVVPGAGDFLNISTRLAVGIGDNVLIGGFIITGTDAKKVLLRGIGPSLAPAVQGVLANPTIELHEPDGTVVTNNNWRDTQEQAIIDTTIAPTNDLESAIVATLDPGAYTVILRGVNDGTGVGLVETYDLDQTANSQLANISTRGFVQTGDNVMIGGVIVGPTGATTGSVLLRAIGPSLADSGIENSLADPTLELHDGDGNLIASNDNWRSTQEAEIEATGIPPADDQESAILATLGPGAYTAIVLGAGGTIGVGLVEAYHLD